MTRFHVVSLTAIFLSLGLAACSGGTGQQLAGSQCPLNYQPGSQAVDPQYQKALTKADGTIDLKTGVYRYNHADLYYVDSRNAPLHNYRILVQDVAEKDGAAILPTTSCVRNRPQSSAGLDIQVSTTGLSALTVGTDSKPTDLEAKNYAFSINDLGQTTYDVGPVDPAQKPTDPSGPYQNQAQSYIYIHPDNQNIIEVRTSGTSAHGNWTLSTTFVREDLPKTP